MSELKKARTRKNYELEESIINKRLEGVRKIEEADPQYGKIDPDCDICYGKGDYETSCDPSGNYDWWVIGDRWDKFFSSVNTKLNIDEKELFGNIAIVSEIRELDLPPAIITPEGFLYEVQFFGYRDMRPWEEEEILKWESFAKELLEKYNNNIVIAVDCHS